MATSRTSMFQRIVSRPIGVLMLSLAAALFGILAYQQLPIALMPPLSYPTLTVQTTYLGAAPEEVESELTQPLEEQLSTLEGLTSMKSRSRAGTSEITLELKWGTQLDSALQRVYERIDRMRFPPEVDPPIVLRYDPTLDPLIVLSLYPGDSSAEPHSEASLKASTTRRSPEQSQAERGSTQDARASKLALAITRRYAEDELAPLIYQVEGVAAVKVTGGERPLIDVRLRPDALQRVGLTVEQVTSALTSAQVNQAGGLIHTERGDILVRTISELRSLDDIRGVVIERPTGADALGGGPSARSVTLGEVAEVERSFFERTSWGQLNTHPAVRVQIYRQADSDLVEVSRRVRAALFGRGSRALGELKLKVAHPPQLRAALISDQARFIERALAEVNAAIALGGLLAILILYAFLASWSQTLIVAVAIPLSVILAFVPLQLAGVSLNLMSLGGLALGVGMLVDNAVVVLESISRQRELGQSASRAAELGAREVASAVFASTLTTVAVFAPVAFIEGFAGQVFRDLALTVVSALIASLLVALFVVPTLAARFKVMRDVSSREDLSASAHQDPPSGPRLKLNQWSVWWSQLRERKMGGKLISLLGTPLVALEWTLTLIAIATLWSLGVMFGIFSLFRTPLRWIFAPLRLLSSFTQRTQQVVTRRYIGILRAVTAHPWLTLLFALTVFVGAYHLQGQLARVLLPEVAQGVVIADLDYPVGTSVEGVARRVQPWIQQLSADPKIARVDLLIGQDESSEQPGERREPHQARLTVQLNDPSDERSLRLKLRELGLREAGATLKISRPSLLNTKPPLRVLIYGQRLSDLRRAEDLVVSTLHAIDGLTDIERTFGQGFPEVRVIYDYDKLAHRGLNPRAVADQIKSQLSGREALELIWGGELLPVRVRARYADTINREDLPMIPIRARATSDLPLSSLADLRVGESPAELRHVDGARAAEVTARLDATALEGVTSHLRGVLTRLKLPRNVEVKLAGQEREVRESVQELTAILLISLFLVFVVMATQFESIRIPILIMGSVPLAIAGVIFGLWLTQTPISVVVFVGMITLSGVVVNNAIVYLDAAERARSLSPEDHELHALVGDDGNRYHTNDDTNDDMSDSVSQAIYAAGERRLRPILMTTLTTLFGLVPMLTSTGEGSELRSPLALTLIFGLASSTLLVLYVLPALYQIFAPRRSSPFNLRCNAALCSRRSRSSLAL